MSDTAQGRILNRLRRIRASQARSAAKMDDLTLRVSAVDDDLGQIRIWLGGLDTRIARLNERLSRVELVLSRSGA